MYRDSGSLWQAENQSLREKLLRLGHSPAELQGTASQNIIEEASDSIVGKPIISLPFGIVGKAPICVDFTTISMVLGMVYFWVYHGLPD